MTDRTPAPLGAPLAAYEAEHVTVPITDPAWPSQRRAAAYAYLLAAFALEGLDGREKRLIEWLSTWEADAVELLGQLIWRSRGAGV